MIVIIITYMKI